ncbi:MAG: hypothetical protein EXQ48_03665 [Acidobacteria bacterium]|nr:hypothetical protein [Acidobacteriota bacterium]
MTRVLRNLSMAALMVLLTCAIASAQLSTAELAGTVRDSSGAVLPGVTVTVTQTDTGFTRTVVTDDAGGYLFPNLPTGPYKLDVSLQGFKSYQQTGIVLQVGSTPTINATLGVGNLEETVSVEASTPLVDVRSAGISEVVENERIVELPLQGRQVTSLLVLAGAAVDTGNVNPRSNPGGVSISVGGGLSYGVAYLLDGAMHNDPYNNLNFPLPFPDALQEFSVATSGLSAQNGMHSGASVNAVTKSGTNRFSGNAFEFIRDKRFNATNPFSAIGPDGKRIDDGLKRSQFGGTIGGPILTDKLFFFGAFQGTIVRQVPSANIAWVPTGAMLAGDFSAFTSPACNQGRQIALRAPFVNNQVSPALFSPAALNLARKLPGTTDPCGQVTWGASQDGNEGQSVGKVDYQISTNHNVFGRYMYTNVNELPVWDPAKGDILSSGFGGGDRTVKSHSLTLGDTFVLSSNVVNSVRFAYNRGDLRADRKPFVDAASLGSKVYTYFPGKITLSVTGGFNVGQSDSIHSILTSDSYQAADDLTLVRGSHQFGIGGNIAYWNSYQQLNARSGGQFTFNGSLTGLGLADFLTGRLFRLEQGAPNILPMDQTYIGVYAQDAWRVSSRVTLNGGLRWEPYFGMNVQNGAVSTFSLENFQKGIKSKVFNNAPAGLLYPGDPEYKGGKSGVDPQWWNLSPRAGVAWDVHGNGRLAFRSSYGLAYDFPSGQYHFINAGAAPFANRLRVEGVSFDDPYAANPGGNPFPIPPPSPNVAYPSFGSFGTIDPNINSTRVQTWNVTLEQQFGTAWQGSVSYLGSYLDHLWNQVALNPGQYLGQGPCTIVGVTYPVCTVAGNLDQRRVFYTQNPKEAQFLGPVDRHTDVGTQGYRGLKLSFRRRAAEGLSLSGNYTLSHCVGNTTPAGFPQISAGYLKPDDPDFDRGNCVQSRNHIANFTAGIQTPQFAKAALRALASDWRVSGILSARSGSWLTVTTGRDIAATGISAQRLNQALENPYGDKSLNNYLSPAAFAYPANGTLGNHVINSIEGPGYWAIDLGVSRLFSFSTAQNLEFRVEAFNLLNNFNWGNPQANYDVGTFGRITTTGGAPRIMQFAVKYGF